MHFFLVRKKPFGCRRKRDPFGLVPNKITWKAHLRKLWRITDANAMLCILMLTINDDSFKGNIFLACFVEWVEYFYRYFLVWHLVSFFSYWYSLLGYISLKSGLSNVNGIGFVLNDVQTASRDETSVHQVEMQYNLFFLLFSLLFWWWHILCAFFSPAALVWLSMLR